MFSMKDGEKSISGEEKQGTGEASKQIGEEGNPHESCEKKYAGLSDKYLRICAEFENYKKRTAKEKEALSSQSEARLMLRLLPVYEEIALAENEVSKIGDKATREGALMVLSKMRKAFEAEGLQPMKLEGEKLDPFRHEVALQEESTAPHGQIVRVIRQGYLYNGAVLQHAIVSVSSGKKGRPGDDGGKSGKDGEQADAISKESNDLPGETSEASQEDGNKG